MIERWTEFATLTPPHILYNNPMKNFADKYFDLIQQLMYQIATILGFWVGVAVFLKRAWVSNDMSTKVRNATYKTLTVVNNISHKLALEIEEKEMAV